MPVSGSTAKPSAEKAATKVVSTPVKSAAEKVASKSPTVGKGESDKGSAGPGGAGRTTFRPPWVKEGASPSQLKAQASQEQSSGPKTLPWARRTSTNTPEGSAASKENGQPVKEVKLQSREIKVPVMTEKPKPVQVPLKPKEKETKVIEAEEPEVKTHNSSIKVQLRPVNKTPEKSIQNDLEKESPTEEFQRPKLKPVVTREKSIPQPTETEDIKRIRPVLKKTPKFDEITKPPPEPKNTIAEERLRLKKVPEKKLMELQREATLSSVPAPPPMPQLRPTPPAPPPPPPTAPPVGFEKKSMSEKAKQCIEKLKQRPRRRPDWSEMMKEVEEGKKLKHVECNDRSKPIITTKSMTKVSGQFVYETEKANIHNQLLKQIQFGVRLKPTKCNDRSKPILEGLRKFRRQMTIEEQIQKSESRAALAIEAEVPDEESEDEMDDIDKLRDDLQSTKQLLALELRNKEAQERENKRLLAKIANLEAELEREKSKVKTDDDVSSSTVVGTKSEEALVKSLKKDAEEARKTCQELEKKYHDTADQLDTAKGEIEEHKRQISALEKKLSGQGVTTGARRPSQAAPKDSSPEPEPEESESESDEDEEKKASRLAKKLAREVKMLVTKLAKLKDKQAVAKKERVALKETMKKNQITLKEENKKFRKLQKEVDKMAAMMKAEEEEDEEDDEDEEEEEEEEEEETETEDETETEESGDESDTETESESEDEDASDDDKKANLEPRVKRHEGRLTALKKGNYLLQANADRLQDEINKIREKSVTLQADLDSVLSELG